MGRAYLSSIPVWTPGDSANEDDVSQPIGRVTATEAITLTRVLLTDAMTVEYGPEDEGFDLWRGRPLEVRTRDTPPGQSVLLMTIEIATRQKERQHATAIISVRPSSADWFGWAPFKTVSRNPTRYLQKLLDAAVAAPSQETGLWAALSAMNTDPFGNEDKLYARFRQLERTDTLSSPDDYYSDADRISVTGTKPNRALQDPEITFGICDRFDDCRALLKATVLLSDTLQRAQDGEATKHDGTPLPLTPTAQSLAREIMDAAIVKAMAGPGSAPRPHGHQADSDGSVAVLAKWIFEDDIRNLHRRTAGNTTAIFERLFLNQLPLIERAGQVTSQGHGDVLSQQDVQALIEKAATTILAAKPAVPEAWAAILTCLRPGEDRAAEPESRLVDERIRIGCVYAAALSRIASMPDVVIERLKSLRRAYPVFVEAALGPAPEP